MITIEQITTVATRLGWQVSFDTREPNRTGINFQRYTTWGQDFNFYVWMKENDTDSLLSEIEDYYEGFDPDYEAYLWIGTDGHGKNGAPYHIKDIVDDMKEAENAIDTLYIELKKTLE